MTRKCNMFNLNHHEANSDFQVLDLLEQKSRWKCSKQWI